MQPPAPAPAAPAAGRPRCTSDRWDERAGPSWCGSRPRNSGALDLRTGEAFNALHLVKKQAMSEFGEVHVAGNEILAQRYLSRLAEEGSKPVDESHVARGRPGPPMRHLNALAITRIDAFRPGIDDEGHVAIPFPADGDDLVEIAAGNFQSTPAPLVHEGGIERPAAALPSQGGRGAEGRGQIEVVSEPEGRKIAEQKLTDVEPVKRRGAHGSVRSDLLDVRIVVDVRQIEKDVDLGGLQAQPLGGHADLAMVDGRTEGRDAEVPDGFALLRGIARHQPGKALLV